MLQALAEAVREFAKREYHLSVSIEGASQDGWLVVDLGNVVLHLFSPDQREYYQLEKLWERGKRVVSLQ